MKESALEARGGEMVLFEDLHRRVIACIFCGDCADDKGGRWMCHGCRQDSLFVIFWKVQQAVVDQNAVHQVEAVIEEEHGAARELGKLHGA